MVVHDIVWDLDGTILCMVLESDFFGYAERFGGRKEMVRFNRLHPLVRPCTVKSILTARPEYMREITKEEMQKHGIRATLFMKPTTDDHCRETNLAFKAAWLNAHRTRFYVDDDPIYTRQLQPMLDTTVCLSVEEAVIGL